MGPIKRHYKALEATLQDLPRPHLIALTGLCACLVATQLFYSSPKLEATASFPTVTTPLALNFSGAELPLINEERNPVAPDLLLSTNKAKANIEKPEPLPKEFTVQSGDSLSLIFRRAALNDKDIYELFGDAAEAKALRSIKPGQKLAFTLEDGKLQELVYTISSLESLTFSRESNGFTAKDTSITPDVKYAFREGTIDSSLFMAGKRAGLGNAMTMELATIFGWDIDFALDIQKGDSFKVMFEEHHVAGKRVGTGKILAAEFTNAGKTFKAVRYTNKEGVSRYYTPDGRGMQKAFLRTPIEFARISSHFTLGRMHPVLHIMRAHKGTDYAAVRGTPIRATGDGKIAFAGTKGGFGNCIVINHGSGYETLYGHMSAFAKGMRAGTRISQGDIIGYVGSTGLASGPHLHYEFHVNGQVRNPVTVPLPKSMGIDKSQLARFNASTQPIIAKLDQFSEATHLAMAKSNTRNN